MNASVRRSTRLAGPLFLITAYYGMLVVVTWLLATYVPGAKSLLPFGGIETLAAHNAADFEVVTTMIDRPMMGDFEVVTLAMAIFAALLLMAPISWVYFITTRAKKVNRSFAQTMVVLPVVVAGIAMIVQNSLPLAFSLAGIVAAVRFRFTLNEPAHALYVFIAIAVGLGAGISALGVSFVTSVAFVYINLLLWKLDYGDDLTTPFFSFLTGRGHDDKTL